MANAHYRAQSYRILASLYNGHVYIWNYAEQVLPGRRQRLGRWTGGWAGRLASRPHAGLWPSHARLPADPVPLHPHRTSALLLSLPQSLVKSFEVTDLPVRTAKFVPRKQVRACRRWGAGKQQQEGWRGGSQLERGASQAGGHDRCRRRCSNWLAPAQPAAFPGCRACTVIVVGLQPS